MKTTRARETYGASLVADLQKEIAALKEASVAERVAEIVEAQDMVGWKRRIAILFRAEAEKILKDS